MMYVAPRVGESVEISDNVVITVVSVGDDAVRLGVTAPRNFPVELEGATHRDSSAEPFSR